MQNSFTFNNLDFTFKRYPDTKDNTLKAFSNAEIYALNSLLIKKNSTIGLYNDRFGFWNTCLSTFSPLTVWHYHSQTKAIEINLTLNNISFNQAHLFGHFDKIEKQFDVVLIKVPKSIDLFELYLEHIWKNSTDDVEVICCFMTKYFNKRILEKANLYFDDIKQSLAWKKSRLLTLRKPKADRKAVPLKSIEFEGSIFKQYPGVFSASHIDYATEYLMSKIRIQPNEIDVLDLASGNGVLAHYVQTNNPDAKLTLVDDFSLAIESSKLNLSDANFLCLDSLNTFEDNSFDLVISNPPFHFEHENNIEVTLKLMEQVSKVIKPKGRFVFVSNNHLNYKTHLIQWFSQINLLAKNEKFIIVECKH